MEDVCTLLLDSGLGHSYWVEAAAYSVNTRNLIPSQRHPGSIPLESFSGKRQDVSHLRTFGAKCWAKILTVHGVQVTGGSKLDPRGLECRFLGYKGGSGNYKVQDVVSLCVFVSRDVIFEEGQPHRTSPSVEENIPIFDTTNEFPLDRLDDKNNDADNAGQHLNISGAEQRDHDNHVDIPMEPIQQTQVRRSS